MKTAAQRLGFSSERLSRIEPFLERQYLAPGRLPGALTLVARRGEIAHLSVQGLADVERAVPLSEETIFRIYSMTKPITSIAFMMLVEEGRVALEDPVEAYIPTWRDLGVFVAGGPGAFQTRRPTRPMQIVDLLRHTSGLTYGFQNRGNIDAAYRKAGIGEMASATPLAEMIEKLATIPLEFSPGEAWNYSVSTDVLGHLIGEISGVPFADFVRERITGPLGMVDTDFHVPAAKAGRLAACYNRSPSGGLALQDDPATSAYLKPPAYQSGGGGLVSTAADYLRFCSMLLGGGRLGSERLISRKTLSLMTANHLPGGADLTELSRSLFSESVYAGVGFGLGFAVLVDPAKALLPSSAGEYYWGGAASTAFWIDPAEEIAVVFLTQLIPSSAWPIRRQLRTLVYAALDD
ncbi:MAG: serine hydrolase domain-containing protein [Caulobacteraceae bacterium]